MAEIKVKAIVPIIALQDQREKEGHLVTIAQGGCAVATSATADVRGLILDGNDAGLHSDIAILGTYGGTAHMKLSGPATRGQKLMLQADGTVKGAATGLAVGIALQDGAAGELIEAAPINPTTIA